MGLLLHVKSHVPMPEPALARLALRELRRLIGEAEVRHLKPREANPSGPTPAPTNEAARKAPGRKPSPATTALREAMLKDQQAGGPRPRSDYLAILREAGGPSSDNAAGIIVNREAKRIFGHPLGRTRKPSPKPKGSTRKAGRQASPATALLRAKLSKDAEAAEVRDAPHYVRWLVDQPDAGLGLKRARPLVYRELAAMRKGRTTAKD